MEGVNRDYDDVHKSRQPNLYGKNSFGYSKNEDEIRQRHKHHDLSDQIVEHDISSYEINRNLSNKPSNNQDTRLKVCLLKQYYNKLRKSIITWIKTGKYLNKRNLKKALLFKAI